MLYLLPFSHFNGNGKKSRNGEDKEKYKSLQTSILELTYEQVQLQYTMAMRGDEEKAGKLSMP